MDDLEGQSRWKMRSYLLSLADIIVLALFSLGLGVAIMYLIASGKCDDNSEESLPAMMISSSATASTTTTATTSTITTTTFDCDPLPKTDREFDLFLIYCTG
ncbi:Oidioi.mRNA.OKI2018_I69.chr2.g5207.t1.cds [Oikopleura dioica]|uniref:Oidioi.mRNA.OKI2018_I69.chr2.g5207.t1.cds n=1 Tax=Oikopleura dioica TaxID=34765 RepID=A0ABN7T6B4_OIKDI|nr:Oidioi.mRNA.OKI2018_I69.chr2.g5207.t1.cds [Oikopleura dioica]